MKIFAILGHPVSHSLSPKLHNAVFHEMGLEDRKYEFLDVTPEKLEDALEELRKGKYSGFSVTIPYKQEVMKYLEEVSDVARKVGAVNTILSQEDGTLWGDNTDYVGFAKSLEEAGIVYSRLSMDNGKAVDHRPSTALVLGSGGAAQAVIEVLHDRGYNVTVATRGKIGGKLSMINDQLSNGGNIDLLKDVERRIILKNYDELDPNEDYQLIVNTTPVGMEETKNVKRKTKNEGLILIEDDWYNPGRIYVDVIYMPKITPFLRRAQKVDAKIVTGDRMFLWQAVEQAKYFCEREEVRVEVMEQVLASLAS